MTTPVAEDSLGFINFLRGQGARFRTQYTYAINGVPVDLTGWGAEFTIRSSAATLVTATVGSGVTLSSSGVVTIAISATVMADIPAGSYSHTLMLIPSAAEAFPLMAGGLTVADV